MSSWEIRGDLQSTSVHAPIVGVPAICSPYLTRGGWRWFCERYQDAQGASQDGDPRGPRVLTCLSAQNAANGSLDLDLLEDLITRGSEVRTLPDLHAKIVLVPPAAMLGSANLTAGGVERNREVVFQSVEEERVRAVADLFQHYWSAASEVAPEDIETCRREAASLPITFPDDHLLAARWNARYVLVRVEEVVLGSIRGLILPPDVLGYSVEDTERVRRSTRITIQAGGEGIVKSVKRECKEHGARLKQLLHSAPWAGDSKALPIDRWEILQSLRREWETELRRALSKRLEREYERLRNQAYEQAETALRGFHKEEGPSMEGLLAGLKIWFDKVFPGLQALGQDAKVVIRIKGIHPLQFHDEAKTRDAILEDVLRPAQPEFF